MSPHGGFFTHKAEKKGIISKDTLHKQSSSNPQSKRAELNRWKIRGHNILWTEQQKIASSDNVVICCRMCQ